MKRFKKDINPGNGRYEVPMICAGKPYTLFKREQSPEAPWYVRLQRRGKDVWASLETADAELAQNKAKTKIEAVLNDDQETLARTRLRNPLTYATLGQVRAIYLDKATAQKPKKVLNTLQTVLRASFDGDLDRISMAQLTGKTVREYQDAALKRARGSDDYRAALIRAQVTANSTWNQARSVFRPGMMAKYRDAGLLFPPTFADFVSAPKLDGGKPTRYVQPSDDLLQRTLRAGRRLATKAARLNFAGDAGDEADRRVIFYSLAIGCGLRVGEIKAAVGGWFGEVNGQLSVTVPPAAAKDDEARQLTIPEEMRPYLLDYMKRRKIGAKDQLIRAGGMMERTTSRWLRKLGWRGSKTCHALRKYYGFLIASQHGMEAAQYALGHADIATTQRWYAGVIKNRGVVVVLPPARIEPTNIVPLAKTG